MSVDKERRIDKCIMLDGKKVYETRFISECRFCPHYRQYDDIRILGHCDILNKTTKGDGDIRFDCTLKFRY